MTSLNPSRPISPWQIRLKRFRRSPSALASFVALVGLTLFCATAWPLARYLGIDPLQADLFNRFAPASTQHWLGTDELGRDVLVRLMLGGQTSLMVAVLATGVACIIGLGIGITAGYVGGKTDAFLMRITDGVIALPLLPLLIVLAAIDLTKLGFTQEFASSPTAVFCRVIFVLSLVDWTGIARLTRAATLSERERDYVVASKAFGATTPYLMLVHILPNVASPLIVAVTLTIGRMMLLESALSFLGLGIVPPTPSWGNMLNNAQELISLAPELAIYPGLLIFVTVIAVNFLGDGLQHAFNPRQDD